MIKVLHFYKTYYPNTFGGIEQVIYQLAEGGISQEVESVVLSLSQSGEAQNQMIAHHQAVYAKSIFEFASTPISLSANSAFKKLAEQADIIHYHYPYPFMDIVHFLSGVKKPTVVSYHSDIVKQKTMLKLYTPLMNRFFNKVDHIIASSPNYMVTSQVLQQFKDKVSVIPYGLDKNSYPDVSEEKKTEWQQKIGDKFFLFIGTFRYYKGLHILIEAAKGAPYPIVIVGSGPIENELKAQCDSLGITNVHFLGALPDQDKAALLQLCIAIVFPSYLRSEAFGITLLEGAMYSKPMISCEIGTGTTYVNIADETGLVVPPADPQALRNAMDTLWNNPDKVQEFGQNAGKRFSELFTCEHMINQYIDVYKSLLAKG